MKDKHVDLRVLAGTPIGNLPIMIKCPLHDDPNASMAVYKDHLYCHGTCQRFIRRFAGAALLLGAWDGSPATELAAVRAVRPMLDKLPKSSPSTEARVADLDLSSPATFHRYLLSQPDTLAYFMAWRGLTEETIHEHQFGYTGSHFTIPVYSATQDLLAIRYRQDDRQFGTGSDKKYSGLSGRNTTRLYDMRCLCDSTRNRGNLGELWVVEGEYDSAVGFQLGANTATLTNGAGQLVRLPDMLYEVGIRPNRWIIATDQDEAGDKAADDLQRLLGNTSQRAVWPSAYKDLSEFSKAGGRLDDIGIEKPLTERYFFV